MVSTKYLFRAVRNLVVDLAWSIKYHEAGIAWYWKKSDRYENGYHYFWYDGPNSVIWLGPLHIWWMGDSFEQDYRKKAK